MLRCQGREKSWDRETACYTYQLQTSPELAEEQESCSPEDRA